MSPLDSFMIALRQAQLPSVLEIGTRRSNPDISTAHDEWVPEGAKFTKSDFQDGIDVDVVADLHTLSLTFGENKFDFIIACSVFEHVQRPWIAVPEICKTLKPGGQVFIQTHQSFPVHGFPHDYWRFTREALETLFQDGGLEIMGSNYDFPCTIHAPGQTTHFAQSYLNVAIVGRKPVASDS